MEDLGIYMYVCVYVCMCTNSSFHQLAGFHSILFVFPLEMFLVGSLV